MDETDLSHSTHEAEPQAATQKLSPTVMQGLLGAAGSGVTRELRGWSPPSVEELQDALPQYEITAFIARGGMGAVYKGVQRSLKRTVAIKVLPPGMDDDEGQFAARFQHEAQAMARLSHPNIVAVHEAGEVVMPEQGAGRLEQGARSSGTLLYFVMEFIEGTDVAELIASEGQLHPQRAVQITCAVCEALAFAHEEGIIHRDIKPSNVMIDKKGRVKVADFGLAKTVNLDSSLVTGSSVTMGTPDFIAPEAMTGGTLVDQRADIYAVGVMLYQMLTGKVPRGRFDSPSQIMPQVDKGFDPIVDKALQTDREKRYSTATELKGEVEKVVPGFSPHRIADTKDSASPKRNLHGLKPMTTLAAVAAVIVLGFIVVFKDKATPSSHELAAPSSLPTHESGVWHLPDGEPGFVKELVGATARVRNLSMLPDGCRVVSIGSKDRKEEGHNEVILWDVPTGRMLWQQEVVPSRTSALDDAMVILPRTNEIVVAQRNPVLMLHFLKLATGEVTQQKPLKYAPTKPNELGPGFRLSVSPDGSRFAVAIHATNQSRRGAVHVEVFNASGGAMPGEWSLGGSVVRVLGLEWLDNNRLLIGYNDSGATGKKDKQAILNVMQPDEAPVYLREDTGIENYLLPLPGGRHVLSHLGTNMAIYDLVQQSRTGLFAGSTIQRRLVVLKDQRVLCLSESGNPRNLSIWNTQAGAQQWMLSDPRLHDAMVASPDGSYAVTNMLDAKLLEGVYTSNSSTNIAIWRLPKVSTTIATASRADPFVNTLGMKFVPVPQTKVLFCIHETRKQDYAAYAAETPGVDISWKQATDDRGHPVGHENNHPVVSVSWEDAQAFCKWLSAKEGRRYRLPTDREWSFAVGIGHLESTDRNPGNLSQRVPDVYPWGTQWPPPPRSANLADTAFLTVAPGGKVIPVYEDGSATTAPVMSFPQNELGIHDLGGNVWEWCEDKGKGEGEDRVGRGGAFDSNDVDNGVHLLSSYRVMNPPGNRTPLRGFRIVAEKP